MGKILLGVGLVDGTDLEEIDGHETPQKSHWAKFYLALAWLTEQMLRKLIPPTDGCGGGGLKAEAWSPYYQAYS